MLLVAPLPLSETINRVLAMIVLESRDASPEAQLVAEIRTWARERLPAHQVPRQIRVLESLPRTPSGKLIRKRTGLVSPG